ncbi:MAG: hypothetical protein DRJ05_16270 [Bacteroidetes bacterium]|nr:MAG: hypothetical protein DRJ05_16270 [Bacteroidota bacterium]
MRILNLFIGIFLFALLTILTQIGGIVYLFSLAVNKTWKANFKFKPLVSFIGLYVIATFLIVPFLAPIFGREKVKHTEIIRPTNYMTVVLNRNYVRPELNDLLAKTEKHLEGTGIPINYLDANFPFVNKFPLLPHLSHNNGKKIDLSLVYENQNGQISKKQKSRSGYGVFASPKQNEFDQIEKCINDGYFQYDYPKYLSFGTINPYLIFSEKGTRELIESILKNPDLGKLFIEHHLKQRLNLEDNKVRYHGCRSVRHDDHIHIQLK